MNVCGPLIYRLLISIHEIMEQFCILSTLVVISQPSKGSNLREDALAFPTAIQFT